MPSDHEPPHSNASPLRSAQRGTHFLRTIGPVGGGLCAAWMFFYAWCGYPWPVVACNLPVMFAGLSMPRAVRSDWTEPQLATVASLCLTFAIVVPLAYTGGVRSFNAVWLLVVPYVAVVGGAKQNWVYPMAAAALSIVGLTLFEATGQLPAPIVHFPIGQPFMSWASALGVMTVSILVHHRFVERTIEQEQDLSRSLRVEIDEHKQTQANLASTQRDLVEAGRVAGMAEVANGVLHNVGNGLNTVNVGVALLAERPNPVPTQRLTELAELIEQPNTSRTAVGSYLRRVVDVAIEQYSSYRKDTERLRHQVEHVNTIVQAQQHYARHGGLVAEITVPELLDDTLILVAARLQGIAIHQDRAPDVTLSADRHKTMLVLLNLLNNAADAVEGCTSPTIHIAVHSEQGHLVVQIADNGVGIPEDNLHRIFHHGFTTKPDGNGFGLHSSAIAARELGGSLQAHSPGNGRGATFTFTVPLNAIRPQRASDQESVTPAHG